MTNIATDVTDLIGGTPLVRINRLKKGGAEIVAKVEAFNPASSVKDRIARSIVDAAEASGQLKPGGTIIEATSGNTGVALAMVGAARGYKVVIVMPSSMSVERRILIRAFGAELVLTDPKGGVTAAVEEAERIRDSRPGSIIASQFTNPANPAVHRRTTAEEILRDTDENIDYCRCRHRRHCFWRRFGAQGTEAGSKGDRCSARRVSSSDRWTGCTSRNPGTWPQLRRKDLRSQRGR